MQTPWAPADPVLLRLRFHVTAKDMVDAQRTAMRWRFTQPRSFGVPLLLALGASVINAAIDPAASAYELAEPFLAILAIVVATRLAYYLAVPLMIGTAMETPYYLDEWEAEFTHAGIRARTRTTEFYNGWEHYVARQEGRRTLLLYHTTRLFQFIPKSALSPEQAEVLAALTKHIPRR